MAYINQFRQPTLADAPGMQQAAQRIKYPEAFNPGSQQPTHGWGYQPNFEAQTGPYSKVPPRSTIDAGKNLMPRGLGSMAQTEQGAYSSLSGSRPMPGTNLVPTGQTGYKPNWTYGDPNFQPPPQTETPGFAEEAKARARAYQARTAAPSEGPQPTFVNDITKSGGLRGFVGRLMDGLSGAGALSTSLASNIIQNPMIANQTNEALARQGLKALIPTSNTRPTAPQGQEGQGGAYTPTLDDYGIKAQREGVIGEGWGLRPEQIKPAQQPRYSQDNVNFAALVNKDNIGMSQGTKGDVRYTQDANGNILREDIRTGQVTPLQNRITSSVNNGQPSPFWQNMGYPGGVEQYRQQKAAQQQQAMQQAQYNQLLDIALNGGPSGDMSPAEFGAAKRRQKMAMGALGMLNDSQRDNARLSQQDRQFGMNYGLQMANADASRQQAINERADKQRDYGLREQQFINERADKQRDYGLREKQFMLERLKYMNPQDEFGMTPEGKMYAKKGNTAKQNYQDMKAFEQQSGVASRILANPDRYTPEQVADAKLVLREWADQGYGDYVEED